jgi:hypothetical protein
MAQQPHYVLETQILRRVMSHPGRRLRWTDHGPQRMEERGISAPDVISALTNGHVTLVETAKRDEVGRIQGKDIDGDPLIVIAVVWEETITIKVVTAFPP